MKFENIFFLLLVSLYIICFTSCSDDNDNKPVISLSETDLSFGAEGGQKQVCLVANGDWFISDIPTWISIDEKSGITTSEEILTLTIETNNELGSKEATLKITRGSVSIYLKITQREAIGDKKMEWQAFPVSSFNSVEYILGSNNTERTYTFDADYLFINPNIDKNIFIGNLINSKFEINTSLTEYKGYTYNPITISASIIYKKDLSIVQMMDTPSKNALDTFVQKIIDSKPTQNETFIYTNGAVKYYSYRQLHLLGVGNLGLNLDEIISGYSYQEQEMAKKTGLVYSFKQTLFTIDMDVPEKLLKEEVKQEDLANGGFSYISSISYGRIGFLLVESDADADKLKTVVDKVIDNKMLTTDDNIILNELEAYYVYFDEGHTLKKVTGKADVIKKYFFGTTALGKNIQPLTFSVSNYPDNAIKSISFSLDLP